MGLRPQASIMQVKTPPDAIAAAATVYTLTENGHLYGTTNGGAIWSRIKGMVLEGIDRRNLVLSAESSRPIKQCLPRRSGGAWDTLGGQPGRLQVDDAGDTWARGGCRQDGRRPCSGRW